MAEKPRDTAITIHDRIAAMLPPYVRYWPQGYWPGSKHARTLWKRYVFKTARRRNPQPTTEGADRP